MIILTGAHLRMEITSTETLNQYILLMKSI